MLLQRNEERFYGIVSPSTVTLAEFAAKWMAERIRLSHADTTQRNYETSLRLHLLPTLGEKKLREIRGADAASIVAGLRAAGRSVKTTNLVVGVLQALLNDAVEMRAIAANPLVGFKPLREELKEFHFWTESEIRQFLTANRADPLFPLYLTALNTGMRRGELCGLKWDRVNLAVRQITVTRTLDRYRLKESTKSGKKRVVPMNQEVHGLLSGLWKAQGSEFIFREEDGSPIDVVHLDRRFKAAQRRAGVQPIRFHDLRHTFASHFMMKGGNVYDLQKILGHSTVKMTERYAHLSPTHLDDAIRIVGFGVAEGTDKPEIIPGTRLAAVSN